MAKEVVASKEADPEQEHRGSDLAASFRLYGRTILSCSTEGLLAYDGFRLTFILSDPRADAAHGQLCFTHRDFFLVVWYNNMCVYVCVLCVSA